MSRTFLNTPIILYRDADGDAVAMEDRCSDRFAPLSKGRLEGDKIRCMYHGLKYTSTGECIEIPGVRIVQSILDELNAYFDGQISDDEWINLKLNMRHAPKPPP